MQVLPGRLGDERAPFRQPIVRHLQRRRPAVLVSCDERYDTKQTYKVIFASFRFVLLTKVNWNVYERLGFGFRRKQRSGAHTWNATSFASTRREHAPSRCRLLNSLSRFVLCCCGAGRWREEVKSRDSKNLCFKLVLSSAKQLAHC